MASEGGSDVSDTADGRRGTPVSDPAERVRRSRKALRDRGGRCVTLNLSPAAVRALARLVGNGTERYAVEAALLAASPPPIDDDTAGWLDVATGRR